MYVFQELGSMDLSLLHFPVNVLITNIRLFAGLTDANEYREREFSLY